MQRTRATLQTVCVLDDICCWEGLAGLSFRKRAHSQHLLHVRAVAAVLCSLCVKRAADQASICVVAKCV